MLLSTEEKQKIFMAAFSDEESEQLLRFKQELYVLKKTIAASGPEFSRTIKFLSASRKIRPIPAEKLTYTPSSVQIALLLTPGSPEYPLLIEQLKNTILDSLSVHTALQGETPSLGENT